MAMGVERYVEEAVNTATAAVIMGVRNWWNHIVVTPIKTGAR